MAKEDKKEEVKLTDKQEKFCKEYLRDLNRTQAAIRAGYSEKTANVIGNENLLKPYIAERIQQLQERRNKKLEISTDSVVLNLIKAMKICLGEENTYVVTNDGTELSVKKTDVGNFIKVQDMLMKHTGMYEKDNKQKDTGSQVTIFELPPNDRG
jgi:phage terminase small subunit